MVEMGSLRFLVLFLVLNAAVLLVAQVADEKTTGETPTTEQAKKTNPQEPPQHEPGASTDEGDEESHAKGSVCSYCSYCKFCTLCDKDCPCKKSKSKPNCHMCKYCKYCSLCSNICDTVCLPGGFLDTVSSSIWNSLPSFDTSMKDAVDQDIDSVKDWIKEYL